MTSPCSKTPWIYVRTGQELNNPLRRLLVSSKLIALDIETTGLDPWKNEILLIQLGTRDIRIVIDYRSVGDVPLLKEFLASDQWGKLGHNLAFDCSFLEVHGMPVRGPLVDTYLGSKVLTAGLPEKAGMNGLAACARRYLGRVMENKTELQKSFINQQGPFTSEQLQYAAEDVGDIILDLEVALRLKTTAERLKHVWELECRALPTLIQMYVNGFKLNVSYYQDLLESEQRLREEKKHEVVAYLDQHGVLQEYRNPETGKVMIHPQSWGRGKSKIKGFNLGSPSQLGVALALVGVPLKSKTDEKTGKVSYSCDKNVLAFYLAEFEVLRIYKEFKEAATACSYTEKLINIAKDYPGHRIHASYNNAVRTGRMSCSNPNLQQLKKGKRYRAGFIAEEGNILYIADYSQLEIRLVAEISGDDNLLKIYKAGEDVHTSSAMLMTGKTDASEVTKEERQAAKATNFGALYGCGPKTLRQQAISMFGILWTIDVAAEKLQAWKTAYPGLVDWQRRQGNNDEPYVYTKFGRRRWLQTPKKGESNYTTNLNTPVQGLGADCLKAALAMLWEQHLADDPEIKIVACVHDEIILEAPQERAEEVEAMLKTCMEDAAPLVGITSVPIVAEPSSGPDWSDK